MFETVVCSVCGIVVYCVCCQRLGLYQYVRLPFGLNLAQVIYYLDLQLDVHTFFIMLTTGVQ